MNENKKNPLDHFTHILEIIFLAVIFLTFIAVLIGAKWEIPAIGIQIWMILFLSAQLGNSIFYKKIWGRNLKRPVYLEDNPLYFRFGQIIYLTLLLMTLFFSL